MNRIPYGCDQQGRFPEAAECCTELGAEQDYSGNDRVATRFIVAVALTIGAFVFAATLAWWLQ